MAIEIELSKKTIKLDNNSRIEIVEKTEDGYVWNEVAYVYKDRRKYVGAYYTYDYINSKEWMEYNSQFIVLYEVANGTGKKEITCLFDIEKEERIKGNFIELLEYLNQYSDSNLRSIERIEEPQNNEEALKEVNKILMGEDNFDFNSISLCDLVKAIIEERIDFINGVNYYNNEIANKLDSRKRINIKCL